MSVHHVNKDIWQITSARTCSRPHKQGGVVDHISKDTWQTTSEDHINKYTSHNHMMTSVKRKLARAMSTCDINKLRHSERITLGVSPLENDKSSDVPKDEIPKWTWFILSKETLREHSHLSIYYSGRIV
jgi:hypothetical protein